MLWAMPLWCQDEPHAPSGPSARPFDSLMGNLGEVVIGKKPELITPVDVRKALTVPALDVGKRLLTAQEAGLREGHTPAIGMLNAAALRAIPHDCPGIKLDKMYYVYIPRGGTKDLRKQYLALDHDFVLDGEVEGKAVGGLRTNQRLFYTEHSLNLRRVRIVVEESGGSFAFHINTARGIGQLQVTGCVFEGLGKRKGNTFRLESSDDNPLSDNGTPTAGNSIGHILFDGNTHQGKSLVQSGALRVTHSCRFIGNTLYDVTGMGICLSTDNTRRYAGWMAYLSCPVWIVGNTFEGVDGVMRKRSKWTHYYCAVLVESCRLYMLHNTIRDFVSGKTLYTNAKGEEITGYCPTYDLYANVTQLYYCHNHVTNVLRFTHERTNFGIIKAKGCCVPQAFARSHPPVTRYYLDNVYDIDRGKASRIWKSRSYPDDGGDYGLEKAYDQSLIPDEYLTLNFSGYAAKTPIDTLVFSGNTLHVPNIGGMLNSSQLRCAHFRCENNTFDARHITSEEYHSRHREEKMTSNKEWLFAVRGAGDTPSIHITGNRFATPRQAIRLMLYKYNDGQPPRARQTIVESNAVPSSSRLVLKSLNSSKWSFSSYPLQ